MADVALTTVPSTPPIPRTRLIGREAEREAGRAFLIDASVPLLTLTGPGGSGKTRLALAIADDIAAQFADGVVWVDLAPLSDASLVPATVARALDVSDTGSLPPEEAILRHLRPRQTLLLIDNCEHVLAAAAKLIATLLAGCPAVQVLATSRAPLRLRGEQEVPVEPLPLPSGDNGSLDALAQNDAVRLFIERARAVRPDIALEAANAATIAEICRRVDGLPLALELAAAKTRILSPAALLSQMTDRLHVLTGGPRNAPARQQTIRDTIAWSYDLLARQEQAVFRRLAVLAGGFTLEAARSVAADDQASDVLPVIERLVEHNLIRTVQGIDTARFTMLETIREFGLERLEAGGEAPAVRDRHAAYFSDLVKRRDAAFAAYLPNSQQVLDELETEFPNLRSALAWQRESGDVASLLELAGHLYFFWQLRSHLRDGRAWLEWGLAQPVDVPAAARAWGQLGLSGNLYVQNELATALTLCEESLRYFRASGDMAGIARASDHAACICIGNSDTLAAAASYIEEALAACAALPAAPWSKRAASHVLYYRAGLPMWQDDLIGAERAYREVIALQESLAREDGAEHPYTCWPLSSLADVARIQGRGRESLSYFQDSLAHAVRWRELRCTAGSLAGVAATLANVHRRDEAARLFGAAEAFSDRAGLAFFSDVCPWHAEMGLPEPWLSGDDSATAGEQAWPPRAAGATRRPPPVSDPSVAAAWIAGRNVPIAVAVAEALAADLDTPAAALTVEVRLPSGHDTTGDLTYREQEVLALPCQRQTDAEIADQLYLSKRTIEHHVSSILSKLGAANRRQAAAIAARQGLV